MRNPLSSSYDTHCQVFGVKTFMIMIKLLIQEAPFDSAQGDNPLSGRRSGDLPDLLKTSH